jgi:hypothetical protein
MTRDEARRALDSQADDLGAVEVFYDARGHVEYIEVSKGDTEPVFEGVPVLGLPAAEVVEHVRRYAPPDREDSASFVFPALDLSLWQSADEEVTFTTVGIGRPGYYPQ